MQTPAQQDLARFYERLRANGEDPRYWRINALEAWYCGTQYEGRPGFWSTDVPLRERAPIVQSQFTRSAVQRLSTLVFGDRSFPRIKVETDAYRTTLSASERDALQALIEDVAQSIALSKRMREVLTEGLKCGAACVVVGVVEGRVALRLLPSKWCTPTLRADGSVASLVVQYKHPCADDPSKWQWHRREITETADRTYDSVDVTDGAPPKWGGYREIPLECCPVIWIRNDAEATASPDQIDGHALVEGLEDEIEALDLELSQLYRNALYNGEPQLVQIGVDGDAPLNAPVGQTSGRTGGFSWLDSVIPSIRRGNGTETAVKKAPGKLWKLPAGGDAKMVESTGAGAEIIRGAITELRRVLTDAAGVVLFDADSLGGGDLAARTLQLMHAPMLDHADNLRVEYGDALVRILDMTLRVLSGTLAQTQGVLLRTYDAARPVLARLYGVGADRSRRWIGPRISLAWGAYFEPSAADRAAAVDTAMRASGGVPVLSHRAAVASVAAMFGINDVDAEASEATATHEATTSAVTETLNNLGAADEEPMQPDPAAPVADTALNGAQVASMVEIVEKVAGGTLPRDSARAIIMRAFAVDADGADAILGSAGMTPLAAPPAAPVTAPPVAFGGR